MSTYLFIDAAYLHEAFAEAMRTVYQETPDIDYTAILRALGTAKRVYYYDAIDREPKGHETIEQLNARVTEKDSLHRRLNAIPLWHVREGFVSRGRASRRQQKGVDVQLAVDALEHAVT